MLPHIELQLQFENFIQQVDKLKIQGQKSLDVIQVLFNSFMQKNFE